MNNQKEEMIMKFYLEIDKALKYYEENCPYKSKTISWICDRISWCWKWRKITKEQMEELADRACKVMEEYNGNFWYV